MCLGPLGGGSSSKAPESILGLRHNLMGPSHLPEVVSGRAPQCSCASFLVSLQHGLHVPTSGCASERPEVPRPCSPLLSVGKNHFVDSQLKVSHIGLHVFFLVTWYLGTSPTPYLRIYVVLLAPRGCPMRTDISVRLVHCLSSAMDAVSSH